MTRVPAGSQKQIDAAAADDASPADSHVGAWAEEIVRTDTAGHAYVRLSRDGRSILLQLSAPGSQPRVLARTDVADLSYTELRGVSEREAARLTRAYAATLRTGRSPAARHLAEAMTGGSPIAAEAAAAETAPVPASVELHRFALCASGHSAVRGVFSPAEIAALDREAERALAAVGEFVKAGRDLAYTFYDRDTYLGTRCLYCWGDACLQLADCDLIHAISDAVIGPHKLFDMSVHAALPAVRFGPERTAAWHRDIDVFADSPINVRYLWFFIYLDDFTAENGAPWIVPGSQRIPIDRIPDERLGADRFLTRTQLLGEAGDVIVINPSALHTVGYNVTERPRRMINVGICHAEVRPLLDHWAIGGPAIHQRATPRLREMLGEQTDWRLDTTWSLLPEGWQTAERGHASGDPATRVFPREQQGFQRSHRMGEDARGGAPQGGASEKEHGTESRATDRRP